MFSYMFVVHDIRRKMLNGSFYLFCKLDHFELKGDER